MGELPGIEVHAGRLDEADMELEPVSYTHLDVYKRQVETVAENASDGVIAPLFYLMIGGAPLGMAYKLSLIHIFVPRRAHHLCDRK